MRELKNEAHFPLPGGLRRIQWGGQWGLEEAATPILSSTGAREAHCGVSVIMQLLDYATILSNKRVNTT